METAFGGVLAVAAGVALRTHPLHALLFALLAAALLTYGLRARRPLLPLALFALLLLGFAGWRRAAPPPPPTAPLGVEARHRGTVAADPRRTADGYRLLVDLEAFAPAPPEGEWREGAGRVTLSLRGVPEPPPAVGDQVLFRAALGPPEGFRNPGSGWHEAYLLREGIGARAFARWPGAFLAASPGPEGSPLTRWRGEMARAIRAAAPGRGGDLVRALALGDRSAVLPETADSFRRAGTAHLLAVSGLHLGIVGLFALLFFRTLLRRIPALALRWPTEPPARLLALAFPAAYAALAGFQTSVVRALVMTGVIIAAGMASRRVAPAALLASTALLVAVIDPVRVGDPALHLSLAALAGIFWLAPALKRREEEEKRPAFPPPTRAEKVRKRLLGAGGRLLRVSAGATLATLPLAAYHFGAAGWAGLFANPVAVPVVSFAALPLSLLGVLLHPLTETGAALAWRGGALAMEGVVRFQELFPAPVGGLGGPWLETLPALVGVYCLIGAFIAWRGGAAWRGRRVLLIAAAGLLLLGLPEGARRIHGRIDTRGHAYLLDVGDGQAAVLRLPGLGWTLVDGGGIAGSSFDIGEEVVVPALRALGCRSLDRVVSTHPHPDHLGGLAAAVRAFGPRELWFPASFDGDARYASLLSAAGAVGASVIRVGEESVRVEAGESVITAWGRAKGSENDRSLALLATRAGVSVLLPGDGEIPAQRAWLAAGRPVACAALVAPHHGGEDAVYPHFFAAAAPRLILVSCGRRRALPSDALAREARVLGASLQATRDEGALHLLFDGGGARVTRATR